MKGKCQKRSAFWVVKLLLFATGEQSCTQTPRTYEYINFSTRRAWLQTKSPNSKVQLSKLLVTLNKQTWKTEKGIEFIFSLNLTQQHYVSHQFVRIASEMSEIILMFSWERERESRHPSCSSIIHLLRWLGWVSALLFLVYPMNHT